MIALLLVPWLGVIAFLALVARPPRELPPVGRRSRSPLVSVVVPARNEALNIDACMASLAMSSYPDFEIVVVDDRSEDGTGEIARRIPPRRARRVVLVEGAPLPDGWLGKPWACHQGAARATGELILFTDADTVHGADLLDRAVAGLEEEDADLLTVAGSQTLGSFWERVVQPQIFMMMLFRFPRLEWTARSGSWREAIANGQYLLFRRASYDALGGHESVRDEVAEDLVLAQRVKRAGMKLRIRGAQTDLATRMYRSLGEIVEGWSKNLVMGGLRSVVPWMRPVVLPISLATGILLWIVPPLALVVALAGQGGPGLLAWAATATAMSLLVWTLFVQIMGASAAYALFYPIGAAIATYIFLRSWVRGRRVEWKGRRYTLPALSDSR